MFTLLKKLSRREPKLQVVESLPIAQERYAGYIPLVPQDQLDVAACQTMSYPFLLVACPPNAEHLDGIPWYKAPIPPVNHICFRQTLGWIRLLDGVERCACGAIRRLDIYRTWIPNDGWLDRNSRSI